MQLNDLKPAWRVFKQLNAMQHIDSNEVLYLIDQQEHTSTAKLPRILLQLMMFILIAIVCQGG